jgi:hypothetical protein
MFRDVVTVLSCGTVSYLWLCVIASPLATSVRSLIRHRADRAAWSAFALALAGAILWTLLVAGALVVGRMLEPGSAAASPQTDLVWRGVSLGNIVWASQALAFARAPRFGPTFETATALAIVAFVRDDPWTLSRVEHLYRSYVLPEVPGAPAASGPAVSDDARSLAA